jgi:uncharacterized protein YjbI with pentapeptide repeats
MTPPAGYDPPQSAEELLRRYAAGERFFPDAEIPDYSSLQEVDLAGASFKGAWLSCIDFRGANLSGCRFEDCNVKCSDFRGADLRNAAFDNVAIEATFWDDAKVDGADFSGVTFHNRLVHDPEFPFGKWGGRA